MKKTGAHGRLRSVFSTLPRSCNTIILRGHWCYREDSNLHAFDGDRLSTCCGYQLRHDSINILLYLSSDTYHKIYIYKTANHSPHHKNQAITRKSSYLLDLWSRNYLYLDILSFSRRLSKWRNVS